MYSSSTVSNRSPSRPSLWVDLLAGAVSGVVSKLVEHPFDTVKVLMQVNGSEKYSGSFDCLKKTVSMYGFRGLFRGVQFPLVGNVVENGLAFISYGYFKRILKVTNPDRMTISQMVLSSMGAGAVISLVISPVELLKCRQQIEQSLDVSVKKSTTYSVIRDVLKTDGPLGLFRGLSLTLAREVPGTSIWFVVYELSLRPFFNHGYMRSTLPMSAITLAGSLSGIVYWSAIYPVDTIKSILQTDANYSRYVNATGWKKLIQTSSYISNAIRSLGIRGLYNGIGFSLLRAVPANAVLFLGYEYSFRLFKHLFLNVCLITF